MKLFCFSFCFFVETVPVNVYVHFDYDGDVIYEFILSVRGVKLIFDAGHIIFTVAVGGLV